MSNLIPGDKEYVIALYEGRLEDAKKHLLMAIREVKGLDAAPALAGFAQRFGSVLLKQGDTLAAVAIYELSESLDRGSLLAKLEFAKFLAREALDCEAAVKKCEEIVSAATANPFSGSDEDFSSGEYVDAANRILEEIQASKR